MESMKDHFNRMDRNKDGFVDLKEYAYYWTGKGFEEKKPAADKPAPTKK